MKLLSLLTVSILFFITACSGTSASRSDAPIRVGQQYGYTNMVSNPDKPPVPKGSAIKVISNGLKNEACQSTDRLSLQFFIDEQGRVMQIVPIDLRGSEVTEQVKSCAQTIIPEVKKVRFPKPTFNGEPVKTMVVLTGSR